MKFTKQRKKIEELEKLIATEPNTELNQENSQTIQEAKETTSKIKIEKLPYSYTSLVRFIDAETMNTHYNKHYKGYVEKLNLELEKIKDQNLELENIIKGISRYNTTVHNNAGGAYNHAIFWNMLSPKQQKPSGPVYDKIVKKYGDYEKFKQEFTRKSKSVFGSGWAWLVLTRNGDIKIMTTKNQDNPLMNTITDGGYPLLGLDVWEHAYYLKYRNKRDEYIKNFFSVINWSYVNFRFDSKTKKKINETRDVKTIILEGASRGCSSAQVNTYRQIFNTNPEVKKKFMFAIMNILKEVFADFWYEKNQYGEGQMSGVYDYEQSGRSVINKLNTNYTAFCTIVNDINEVLRNYGVDTINMVNQPQQVQLSETERLIKYLVEFRYRIFNSESSTFKTLMSGLDTTNKFGDKREVNAVDNLKIIFNTQEVKKVGELGDVNDMIGGIDAIIQTNDGEKTAQIKPFSRTDEKNGIITVYDTGNVKKYKVDYLVFHRDNKGTIVFDNKNTKIVNGNYTFPASDLLNK
jgi:superoxide dismutase, Fe-Mn family